MVRSSFVAGAWYDQSSSKERIDVGALRALVPPNALMTVFSLVDPIEQSAFKEHLRLESIAQITCGFRMEFQSVGNVQNR